MKLKETYKTDELPEPSVTSCDLNDSLEDTDPELTYEQCMAFFKAMEKLGFGTRFTQVDGDDGEIYYVKGYAFVNRTGVCALVLDKVK
jgi:hypothetical protein